MLHTPPPLLRLPHIRLEHALIRLDVGSIFFFGGGCSTGSHSDKDASPTCQEQRMLAVHVSDAEDDYESGHHATSVEITTLII